MMMCRGRLNARGNADVEKPRGNADACWLRTYLCSSMAGYGEAMGSLLPIGLIHVASRIMITW